MSPLVGWGLATLALLAGWRIYGAPGVVLAASVVVFWLLLQFTRSVRVLRRAGESPLGHVASAVMFNAKLRRGMQMLDVLTVAGSLGQSLDADHEVCVWTDDGGAEVVVTFVKGRCSTWELRRPTEAPE